MKRLLLIIVCLVLVGCGSVQTRMTRLKEKNENVLIIPYKGTIQEAKSQIRFIGKEMKLVEPAHVETEDFMELRTNLINSSLSIGVFGALIGSMMSNPTHLGFFFDYNKEKQVTTITIVEEVSQLANASRYPIADRLTKKNIELTKNETK